jgi:hypothetical protein
MRQPPALAADDLDDDDLIDRDYLPAPAGRGSAPVSDELDHEDDLELDREEGHPIHKKIPTWEEAVGVLVEANMASRANSPDRPHRGRGRGRGGR